MVASPSNNENIPGLWVTVKKKRKRGYGDDARIEARGGILEVRVSSIHIRDSIPASTPINVNFILTIRALNLIWYRAGLVTLTVTFIFYANEPRIQIFPIMA